MSGATNIISLWSFLSAGSPKNPTTSLHIFMRLFHVWLWGFFFIFLSIAGPKYHYKLNCKSTFFSLLFLCKIYRPMAFLSFFIPLSHNVIKSVLLANSKKKKKKNGKRRYDITLAQNKYNKLVNMNNEYCGIHWVV